MSDRVWVVRELGWEDIVVGVYSSEAEAKAAQSQNIKERDVEEFVIDESIDTPDSQSPAVY